MLTTRFIRHVSLAGSALLAFVLAQAALAQSAADNIRPVGQVCLAGQACVGTTGQGAAAASTPSPARTSTNNATAAPAAAPAAAQEVVTEEAPAEVAETTFDAAAAYQMSCFACHGTGAAGAPQPGDAEAWEERMAKGMDAVMANVINGVNAMPPRGICMTCSDDDLRAIVDHMLAQ